MPLAGLLAGLWTWAAGSSAWRPSGLVRMHPLAVGFLAEFGGLKVEIGGPGISVARQPFVLDPDLADGEEDRFAEWGADMDCSLFPIGILDRGRFFLGISEVGEIFLVETWVASYGLGDTALENLILGNAPRERGATEPQDHR